MLFAGRQSRPASAAPRGGRGRNNRGRRSNYSRPANRLPSDPDYPDYPTDYSQLPKFGAAVDGQNFVVPYMCTFFYNSNSYINLGNPTLRDYIRKQIEYYFSEENLMRDFFLRRKMDSEGYLPVTLIASFHRVQQLTNNLSLVVEAITNSDKLELSNGFKVRTKHEPTKWPILDKGVLGEPQIMPPLNKAVRDLSTENLNPNVAEFIPHKDNPVSENKAVEEVDDVETEENWKEVKKRTKENKAKKEVKSKNLEREELDFHFDEELDHDARPTAGYTLNLDWMDDHENQDATTDSVFDEDTRPSVRKNHHTYDTDWIEDGREEISDRDVNKLLIVTQAPSSRATKHDRTGDWTTRVKMTQDLEEAINDGLYYYEEDLWNAHNYDRPASGSYKTVNVVSQEEFEKLAPPAPKKQNPDVPPPPPPPPVVPQHQTRGPSNRNVPRFYAVVKDTSPDPCTPRKRKTRHSHNPPIEHHVGWIMDVKEHDRYRTTSVGYGP